MEHGEPFACSECNATFANITLWNRHECQEDEDQSTQHDSHHNTTITQIQNEILWSTQWSASMKDAFMNRWKDANTFYYYFNASHISKNESTQIVLINETNEDKFNDTEHCLFMIRIKELGITGQWGLFSRTIPSRNGLQCSQYWQHLIDSGYVLSLSFVDVGPDPKYPFKRKWIQKIQMVQPLCSQMITSKTVINLTG
eukprot:202166_1